MSTTEAGFVDFFESSIFNLRILHLRAEQKMSDFEVKVYFLLNLMIQIASIAYKINVFHVSEVDLPSFSFQLLCIMALLTLLRAALQISLVVEGVKLVPTDPLLRRVIFNTQFDHAFKFVILPLLIWSFCYELNIEIDSISVISVGIPAVLIGLTSLIFSTLFMTTTIPTSSPLGCLSPKSFMFNHLLLNGIIALGVASKSNSSSLKALFFHVSEFVLLITLLGVNIFRSPFWKSSSNHTYLSFLATLTLVSLWNIMIGEARPGAIHWTSLVLCLGFVPRAAAIITEWQDHKLLFESDESSYGKLRGLLLITNLFNKSWKGELTNAEQFTFHEVKKVLKEKSRTRITMKMELSDMWKDCGSLSQFLTEECEEFMKSSDMAKYEVLARLMVPLESTVKAFNALHRYKKLAGGGGVLERLEVKLVEVLFETRLEAFYWLPYDMDKSSLNMVVYSLFSILDIPIDRSSETAASDIAVPLKNKELFLQMKNTMIHSMIQRNEVYKYIQGKAHSGASLMSIDLYHLNNKAKRSMSKALKTIKSKFEPLKVPPSYFFPSLFVFNSLLLHDSTKARKVMRAFRKNIQMWDLLKSRDENNKSKQVVSDMFSVVLQVSLQPATRGELLDLSPNWEELLGKNTKKDIIGKNINLLMIEEFKKKHEALMADQSRLKNIISTTRDLFIKNFDNEFKSVSFTMRLWPSLEKDLTGVAALKTAAHKNQDLHLVLLTPEFTIIAAEQEFLETVGYIDDTEIMTSILQYTYKFEMAFTLLELFEEFIEEVNKMDVSHDKDTLLHQIYLVGQLMINFNDTCNIVFCADPDTTFFNQFSKSSMKCKLKKYLCHEIDFQQLFIKFWTHDFIRIGGNRDKMAKQYSDYPNMNSEKNSESYQDILPKKKGAEFAQLGRFSTSMYGRGMAIKDKIPYWKELDKPLEIDIFFDELSQILEKIDESEFLLCTTKLKTNLKKIFELVSKFHEWGNIKACHIESVGMTLEDQKSKNNALSIPIPNLIPPSPLLRHPLRREETASVGLSGEDQNKSAIRDVAGALTAFQGQQSLGLARSSSNSSQNQSDNEKSSAQGNNGKTEGFTLKDLANSATTGKAKEGLYKQISTLPVVTTKLIKMSKTVKQNITHPAKSNFRLFNLNNKSRKAGGDPKMSTETPHANKQYAVDKKVVDLAQFDKRERIVDNAASSIGTTKASGAVNERKMHSWIQHKRRSYARWMYSLAMSLTIVIFLASWLVFELIVNNDYYFTRAVYNCSESLSYLNLDLAESINGYFRTSCFNFCQQNGCMEPEIKSYLEFTYGTTTFYETARQVQAKFIKSTNAGLGSLISNLFNSEIYYGPDLTRWIEKEEARFARIPGLDKYVKSFDKRAMPQLDFLQASLSMIARIQWMRDLEAVTGPIISVLNQWDTYREFKTSMINDAYQIVLSRMYSMNKSMTDMMDTSPYSSYFNYLLWTTGAVLALCYMQMLASLVAIQRYLNSAAGSYSLLQKKDLEYELTKITSCIEFFSNGNTYEEYESMNEAVSAFVNLGGGLKRRHKSRVLHGKDKAKSFGTTSESGKAEIVISSRAQVQLSRHQNLKFKSGRPYQGVLRAVFFGTLLIILVLATLSLTLAVDSLVSDTKDLKKIVMKSTYLMVKLNMGMGATWLFAYFTSQDLTYRLPEAAELVRQFTDDRQEIIDYWNQQRPTLIKMLGANSTIERIIFADMCNAVIEYNHFDQRWDRCKVLNQAIAARGLISFLYYEDNNMVNFYNALSQIVNLNNSKVGDRLKLNQLLDISYLFYTLENIEIRAGHSDIYPKVLRTLDKFSEEQSQQKEAQVQDLLSTLRAVGLAVVFVPFVILIYLTGKFIKNDYSISLYTFELLSPDTIISNQYLFSRFKRYFKMTASN